MTRESSIHSPTALANASGYDGNHPPTSGPSKNPSRRCPWGPRQTCVVQRGRLPGFGQMRLLSPGLVLLLDAPVSLRPVRTGRPVGSGPVFLGCPPGGIAGRHCLRLPQPREAAPLPASPQSSHGAHNLKLDYCSYIIYYIELAGWPLMWGRSRNSL